MNKHFYIIVAILAVFLVVLILIIKKLELKPLYIIFVGAGLAVVAAAITAWGTLLQNDRSSQNTQELKDMGNKTLNNTSVQLKIVGNLKKQNDKLKFDLERRDAKIAVQSKKILELSGKLVEKSEYISDHLTGGKGYPLLATNKLESFDPKVSIKYSFEIMNEGDLPLYDITINVFDWDYLQSKFIDSGTPGNPYLKRSDFAKANLSILNENQMSPGTSIRDPQQYEFKNSLLYIKLKSRSSFLYEKMAFVEHEGKIYQGLTVYNKDGDIINEWMQNNTPDIVKEAIKKKFNSIPDKVGWRLIQ